MNASVFLECSREALELHPQNFIETMTKFFYLLDQVPENPLALFALDQIKERVPCVTTMMNVI